MSPRLNCKKCRPHMDAVHTETEPSRQRQIKERQTGLELEGETDSQGRFDSESELWNLQRLWEVGLS